MRQSGSAFAVILMIVVIFAFGFRCGRIGGWGRAEMFRRARTILACGLMALALAGCETLAIDPVPTTATVQEPLDPKYYPSDEPLKLGMEHFGRRREDLARVVRESRGLGCCEVRRPQLLRRIKPVRSRRSESACKGRLDTPRPIGFERVVKPDRDFAVAGAFYPGLPGRISFVIKEAAIRDLPITRRKGEDHVTGAYSPRYPLIT